MAGAAGTRVRSGMFVWEELMTPDVEASKAFYATVLGWTWNDSPVDDGTSYSMADNTSGSTVVGVFRMQGTTPVWGSYIGVDDADAATGRAVELGAEVIRAPFDVMDIGRMAVLRDPAGAVINVWQATGTPMALPTGEHGAVEWREVRSRDIERTLDFYRDWLGWTAEPRDMGEFTYWIFSNGGEQVAGAMQIMEGMGDMPSHWAITFWVDDVDAAWDRAVTAGATTLMQPEDIPGVGRNAVLVDPQGASFGLIKRI